MKIKRYLDRDMRRVLRRVREDQGPDAVILSNRRVEEGIEVIAALDYDEALVRRALGVDQARETAIDTDTLAEIAEDDLEVTAERSEPIPEIIAADLEAGAAEPATRDATAGAHLTMPQPASLGDMHTEIAAVRKLLETQLAGLVWKDSARRSPLRAQMLRNLARIGLAPDVANLLVNRLEPVTDVRNLWHAPLTSLAQMIPVKEEPLLEEGGVFALIGPTGVGKTTTIAKIAARFAMHHWPDDIALVSADAYRIGAREHLAAFANIIGVKVYSASGPGELAEVLERLSAKKLVLIDTEGSSPRDRELASRLAAYGENRDRIRFFLTLSAASQEAGLDEAVRQFGKVPLEGSIVTKIDEAAQLGCVLSVLIRRDLPLVWLSDGQRIPEDFHAAFRKRLWLVNRAVECMETSEPRIDERTMAERHIPASVVNG